MPKKNNIFFSLIIVTYNRINQVKKLIDLIEKSFDKYRYEILIYNQGKELELNIKKNTIIFQATKHSLSYSRNFLITKSKGKYLCLLDDDCEISLDYFDNLTKIINRNEDVDIICGKIKNLCNGKSFSRFHSKITKKINKYNFDLCLSSALIIKKKVIDDIGNFDLNFGLGARYHSNEEADFILRAIKRNLKIIYDPNLLVYHPSDNTNNHIIFLKKSFRYGIGRGRLIRKHFFNFGFCWGFFQLFFNIFRNIVGFIYYITYMRLIRSIGQIFSLIGRIYGFSK